MVCSALLLQFYDTGASSFAYHTCGSRVTYCIRSGPPYGCGSHIRPRCGKEPFSI